MGDLELGQVDLSKNVAESQTTNGEWDNFQDDQAELFQRLTDLDYSIKIDENGDPILSGIRILRREKGGEWVVVKDTSPDWNEEDEGEHIEYKMKPKSAETENKKVSEEVENDAEEMEEHEFESEAEEDEMDDLEMEFFGEFEKPSEKEHLVLSPSYIDKLLSRIGQDIAEVEEIEREEQRVRDEKEAKKKKLFKKQREDGECIIQGSLNPWIIDPHDDTLDWKTLCERDKWDIMSKRGLPALEFKTQKEIEIRELMISKNKFNLEELCEQDWDMEIATTTNRPMTRTEISQHGKMVPEMLVIKNGQVFNLTLVFINGAKSKLAETLEPIYKYVGADVTHWFNPVTGEPRNKIEMKTGNRVLYTPDGVYYGLDSYGRILLRRQRRELKERLRRCFDDDVDRYYESYTTKMFRDRKMSEMTTGEIGGEDDWFPIDTIQEVNGQIFGDYEEVDGEIGDFTGLTKQDLDEFFGAFPNDREGIKDDDTIMAIQGSDEDPNDTATITTRNETDSSTVYTIAMKSGTSLVTVVADDAELDEMWWLESKYIVGYVPEHTFYVKVINGLNRDERIMEVCRDSTINDVMRNYLLFNTNAMNYLWKDLWGNLLHPHKTLIENGMWDASEIFEERGLDHWPVILLHFKDGFEWELPLNLDLTRLDHPKKITLCRNY